MPTILQEPTPTRPPSIHAINQCQNALPVVIMQAVVRDVLRGCHQGRGLTLGIQAVDSVRLGGELAS